MNLNWLKNNGKPLTSTEEIITWVLIGFAALALLLTLLLGIMWIYYSWIKRSNSKDYTGKDITEYIFQKTGTEVEVVSAWMYLKYWNYNKRRNTHKLRPWTHNRKSIWTLMEASQQAYATSIRKDNAKQYWLIFRIPGILRFIGVIAGGLLFYMGLKGLGDGSINSIQDIELKNWIWIGLGTTVILLAYTIADVGRVFLLWKNVKPLLADSGLNEKELKAINRIFFWRLMYSLVIVIIELIKLALKVAQALNKNKTN